MVRKDGVRVSLFGQQRINEGASEIGIESVVLLWSGSFAACIRHLPEEGRERLQDVNYECESGTTRLKNMLLSIKWVSLEAGPPT